MKIEYEQVKHVAALARLRIDDTEMEKWSEQMGNIIEFADRLNELDISDTLSDGQCVSSAVNVFREDERKQSYDREKILKNAPKQYEGCYVVPRIVE